ncbi:MAG: 3-deoxy-D-manno-octulosonic acid transferase [Proteobacteria bacterium]|nr:3-deoxy-D-manno-octulosonic acid transferase [Pseudomonadota bacterium]
MSLLLYRLIKAVLSPVIFLLMAWRIFRGREDRESFSQRLGQADYPRPSGSLVWLHGASVGEVVSLVPVLRELRRRAPHLALLLTTGTTNGHKMLERHVPHLTGTGPAFIQYVPLDTKSATTNFFKHWKPDLSVFVESEFWPELLSKAPRPVLLNGRVSNRSWPRYRRWGWFFRPFIRRFVLALAQSKRDAERIGALGAPKVQIGGNLKFDADPLPFDPTQLEKFQAVLAGRPVLVAASTHPGEEEIVAQLHNALKASVPDLLTVIVPRHPHRGTQAANDVGRHCKSVKRRGLGEMPVLGGQRHTDIYIADTLGELGLWYRLATVALIGGSLVKHGGHNPLEPLKLGIPTVTGPHMFNFQDMVPALTTAGVLTISPNLASLTQDIQRLLTNPHTLEQQKALILQQMPKLGGSAHLAASHILNLL